MMVIIFERSDVLQVEVPRLVSVYFSLVTSAVSSAAAGMCIIRTTRFPLGLFAGDCSDVNHFDIQFMCGIVVSHYLWVVLSCI